MYWPVRLQSCCREGDRRLQEISTSGDDKRKWKVSVQVRKRESSIWLSAVKGAYNLYIRSDTVIRLRDFEAASLKLHAQARLEDITTPPLLSIDALCKEA